ncbi:PLP-dependent transferase [Ascoidea rubescens DSM 1968]|uniref:PLP-dependent transferase n=1 Tax=Ascoidea rubescens DSM 1968 TaxID=1344418 RepID=A0A1D2VEI6_9ASCO|nr:PLP-dependent transferase [Ascoidea rubescens DSM 1968]ODV60061.1 PLP-dependent transferase [Ascoidea rubescens DSM 1968]
MVFQEPFALEQFMDKYEGVIDYNLGETCCYSLSLNELEQLSNKKFETNELLDKRMQYTWIRGSEKLRTLIADFYNENDDITNNKFTKDDVVITNGAIGANFLTLYSLIDTNDHVVVFNPIYQQLNSLPKVFKGEVSEIRLSFNSSTKAWYSKTELLHAIKCSIKDNTKLIIINNPNNPTGTVFDNDVLNSIINIAETHGIYILSDEVYRPLFYSIQDFHTPPSSIATLYNKGISTSSTSKVFSFAGIRLGWIITKSAQLITDCLAKRDYNMISISLVDDLIA